jgi:hypothetical protein
LVNAGLVSAAVSSPAHNVQTTIHNSNFTRMSDSPLEKAMLAGLGN